MELIQSHAALPALLMPSQVSVHAFERAFQIPVMVLLMLSKIPEIVELIQSHAALPAFCTPVHSATQAPEIAAHMESSHARRFVIAVMR